MTGPPLPIPPFEMRQLVGPTEESFFDNPTASPRADLTPRAPHFRFEHFDAYNIGFNPTGSRSPMVFPAADGDYTLVNAWSVFTHILEPDVARYLAEVRRVTSADAMFLSTWFLTEKLNFPMMQEFQNALYINPIDPTNAVIFDRDWVRRLFAAGGCAWSRSRHRASADSRGCSLRQTRTNIREAEFPFDDAPFGVKRPPVGDRPPTEIR